MNNMRDRPLIAGEVLLFAVPWDSELLVTFCRSFSAEMSSGGRGRRLSLLAQQRCAGFPHTCDLARNTRPPMTRAFFTPHGRTTVPFAT
jgi:hypothetical protein